MSLKGGYKIIDFKDINLVTGVGISITGVYDAIKSNYRKAILISGISIDGVKMADSFVELLVNGTKYTGTLYGKTITITNTDVVTIKESA